MKRKKDLSRLSYLACFDFDSVQLKRKEIYLGKENLIKRGLPFKNELFSYFLCRNNIQDVNHFLPCSKLYLLQITEHVSVTEITTHVLCYVITTTPRGYNRGWVSEVASEATTRGPPRLVLGQTLDSNHASSTIIFHSFRVILLLMLLELLLLLQLSRALLLLLIPTTNSFHF